MSKDNPKRRNVLKGIGAASVGLTGITAPVGTAVASEPNSQIGVVNDSRKKRVAEKVRSSGNFESVRRALEKEYSAKVGDVTRVLRSTDSDGEPFYVASFEIKSSQANGDVELVGVVQQEVVKVEGTVLYYQGDTITTAEQYVYSDGELTKEVRNPRQATGQCGCGDIPDICPYCKSAVPVVCYIGCGGALSAICAAISNPAPGAATCLGVVGSICSVVSGGCGGRTATAICEEAGLCQ